MELNQIRDNINLIRTSQQQPASQDTVITHIILKSIP